MQLPLLALTGVIGRTGAEEFIGAAGIRALLLRAAHFARIACGGEVARQQVDALRNIPDHPVITQRGIGSADRRQVLERNSVALGVVGCIGPVQFR